MNTQISLSDQRPNIENQANYPKPELMPEVHNNLGEHVQCCTNHQNAWRSYWRLRHDQLVTLYNLPIYRLPPELVLNILDFLDLAEFPSLMFAIFHLLRHHGIAPSVPTHRMRSLIRTVRHSHSAGPGLNRISYRNLPVELRLQVHRYLNAREKINFLLATWPIFDWNPFIQDVRSANLDVWIRTTANVSAQLRLSNVNRVAHSSSRHEHSAEEIHNIPCSSED